MQSWLWRRGGWRYLCTIDDNYYESLSSASKKSFIIQGGKIDNDFLDILKTNEKFSNAVKMRKYEDLSKIEKTPITIDLNYIKSLMQKYHN